MKNKGLIIGIVIVIVIILLIIANKNKSVEETSTPTDQQTEKQVDNTKAPVAENTTQPAETQAIDNNTKQEDIFNEVNTAITDDTDLDALTSELDKLDLSGNDPDLNLESELTN